VIRGASLRKALLLVTIMFSLNLTARYFGRTGS